MFWRARHDAHYLFTERACEQLASRCRVVYVQPPRSPGCLFDRSQRIMLPRCHSNPVSRVLASAAANEQKIDELDGRCCGCGPRARLLHYPQSLIPYLSAASCRPTCEWQSQSTSICVLLLQLVALRWPVSIMLLWTCLLLKLWCFV